MFAINPPDGPRARSASESSALSASSRYTSRRPSQPQLSLLRERLRSASNDGAAARATVFATPELVRMIASHASCERDMLRLGRTSRFIRDVIKNQRRAAQIAWQARNARRLPDFNKIMSLLAKGTALKAASTAPWAACALEALVKRTEARPTHTRLEIFLAILQQGQSLPAVQLTGVLDALVSHLKLLPPVSHMPACNAITEAAARLPARCRAIVVAGLADAAHYFSHPDVYELYLWLRPEIAALPAPQRADCLPKLPSFLYSIPEAAWPFAFVWMLAEIVAAPESMRWSLMAVMIAHMQENEARQAPAVFAPMLDAIAALPAEERVPLLIRLPVFALSHPGTAESLLALRLFQKKVDELPPDSRMYLLKRSVTQIPRFFALWRRDFFEWIRTSSSELSDQDRAAVLDALAGKLPDLETQDVLASILLAAADIAGLPPACRCGPLFSLLEKIAQLSSGYYVVPRLTPQERFIAMMSLRNAYVTLPESYDDQLLLYQGMPPQAHDDGVWDAESDSSWDSD